MKAHAQAFLAPAVLALALSACATTPTATPTVTSPPVASTVPPINVDTLKTVTRVLSSDEFEGRAPGTAGEDKTIAYLTEQFAAAGLKPGNNGSWVQHVPLVEIAAKDISPLRVNGARGPLSFKYGDQFVAASYRAAPSIAIDNAELVFVGYGVNAPEKGWNDYAGVDMRGKVAVILINDPDYEAQGLTGEFNGRAMTYYGRWTYKFEEAARQGAAGALIVHDTFPAAYGWNVVESSWSGPQAYAQTADDGASQTRANGWIQKAVAQHLPRARR